VAARAVVGVADEPVGVRRRRVRAGRARGECGRVRPPQLGGEGGGVHEQGRRGRVRRDAFGERALGPGHVSGGQRGERLGVEPRGGRTRRARGPDGARVREPATRGHRVAAGEGERAAGGREARVAGEAAARRLLERLVGRLELAEAVAGDA
jgi:hypothetical protein